MDYLIFESLLQIICMDPLQIWWKYVPIFFCVFCIFRIQLDISDDVEIVSISINSIIIIMIIIIMIFNKIIWFCIWLFLKTLVIITKYVTSITNIQILWPIFLKEIYRSSTSKNQCSSKIQYCWSFSPGCIKCSWFIISWCGITFHN